MLTTCARDYVTWRDEYPAGIEMVNGVPVRRFRVDHERDADVFGRWSERVFDHPHSYLDELKWLDAEGPEEHVAAARYLRPPHAGLRLRHLSSAIATTTSITERRPLPSRAILVPTAERDEAIGLGALAADLPRCARAHVQQPGREAAHPGGLEQSRRAGRRRRHRIGDSRAARRPSGSARSTASRDASRSMSGASIRTRAARSCSRSF